MFRNIMTDMLILTALIFFSLIFLLSALWILVPAFYGPPSVPTRLSRVRKALQLADLKPNEVLYDLGAGDGRVLLLAAQEFNAKAVGVEIGPVQCALIWLRAVANGLGDKVRVKWENYLNADLSAADVLFVYATSREVAKLAGHLEKQMKPGARLVSISADFPEWQPSAFDERELIFVYVMPPKHGSLTTYLLEKSG
jgi:SAM-dependent methyltransferase